jgi:general nucleoside transport system permease protein
MDFPSTTAFVLHQAVLFSTPLLLAGFGELIAERAGVINIGIEGLMLMGCIAAYAAAVFTGSAWVGIPAAIIAGMIFAAAFAVVSIWFRADQIVTGTAINILAMGASTTAWVMLQKFVQRHHAQPPAMFEPVTIPWLSKIPVLGPALFEQYALFYAVIAVGVLVYVLLEFSRFGLVIRALGDSPDACDAAGIRVRSWRTALVLSAGGCAGLAGAYLSTMRGHSFNVNMTGGQGFLVLALVIFGRWHVGGLVAGTLLFGVVEGLQSYLTSIPGAAAVLPHQLFDMLPYAATLAALAVLSRTRAGPIYLARPWPEE